MISLITNIDLLLLSGCTMKSLKTWKRLQQAIEGSRPHSSKKNPLIFLGTSALTAQFETLWAYDWALAILTPEN